MVFYLVQYNKIILFAALCIIEVFWGFFKLVVIFFSLSLSLSQMVCTPREHMNHSNHDSNVTVFIAQVV